MKTLLLALALFAIPKAHALVSSPSAVAQGQWIAEAKAIFERGKVEPNENTASFQKASINIQQLTLAHGMEGPGFGKDHFARIDYKHFNSAKEEVAGQLFHEKDEGHVATFSYGFNFVHELAYSAGVYVSFSPLASFNKNKFSNPRVDLWALGIRGALEISPAWFLENSIHIGSGIPGRQNAYLALAPGLGLKFRSLVELPIILSFGPYVEIDIEERTDPKYDAAFSAAGRADRIRAVKLGLNAAISAELSEAFYATGGYVQKLAGYDAPATNASFAALGVKF